MYFLGIDPGQEGALVLIDSKRQVLLFKKMPIITIKSNNKTTKHYDILNLVAFFKIIKEQYADTHIYIEQIGAAPEQGVTSMFTMGMGFGLILGIIGAMEIPHTRVRPNIWKGKLMAGLPKEKLASCVAASRLFPKSVDMLRTTKGKLDHNIADALLIAEWGRLHSSSI